MRRLQCLNAVSAAILSLPPPTEQDAFDDIQALLLSAATLANKLSSNSDNFSVGHVEESANRMYSMLEDTFFEPNPDNN